MINLNVVGAIISITGISGLVLSHTSTIKI